ncbi:MAG: hypothetical protein H0T89_21205 [Deltaproteobacteria bacterium]|nr:hypothetical protein [Deltaproteobacteria bacterium]MDQ3299865.1 hypothetical protein [Myxococcota bacterium]
MTVEIHVACRRDPAGLASLFNACRVARVAVTAPQTIRAWSPRARATLLLRERDVAAIVTLAARGTSDLACEYAELIARTFDGVVVIDGEVIELAANSALSPTELVATWTQLDQRVGAVLAEQARDRQNKRVAWALAHQSAAEHSTERDRSSV